MNFLNFLLLFRWINMFLGNFRRNNCIKTIDHYIIMAGSCGTYANFIQVCYTVNFDGYGVICIIFIIVLGVRLYVARGDIITMKTILIYIIYIDLVWDCKLQKLFQYHITFTILNLMTKSNLIRTQSYL